MNTPLAGRLALVLILLWAAPQLVRGEDKPAASIEIPATDDGLPGSGPIRRYDWFRNLWSQKRGGWARRTAEDQKSLVFLGDSITQGWGDDFGKSFLGVKTANRGISGDTTRGMLIRLQDDVLKLNPTGLVFLAGTNDLEEGAEPETIAANFKLILAEVKKHDPKLPVVLCQVFPSSESKKRPAAKIKKLNELYAAAVKGDPQVTLVETWTLFANEQGDAKPEEFPDLLHPNGAGYAKWAAALRPILATLGYLETKDDDFQPEAGFLRKTPLSAFGVARNSSFSVKFFGNSFVVQSCWIRRPSGGVVTISLPCRAT